MMSVYTFIGKTDKILIYDKKRVNGRSTLGFPSQYTIYIYKEVISVCLFAFPIKTREPMHRFRLGNSVELQE